MSAGNDNTQIHAEERYYEALDQVADGQFAEAVRSFRACLATDPAYLDAMHGLIRALQELGDLDEAIRTALHLSAIDPEDVLVHTSLSILYQRKGMVPEAEAEALKAKLLGWKHQLRLSQDPPEGQ